MPSINTVLNSLAWICGKNVANYAISFIFKLVFAYYLAPEDFGVISLAITIINALEIFRDIGMTAALIQRPEETLNNTIYSLVFLINCALSWICFILNISIIAPLIAIYYEKPELKYILWAISLSLILTPLGSIQMVKMKKDMAFKKLSLTQLSTTIAGTLVGLFMAIAGFGVWSLISMNLIKSALLALSLNILTPWKMSIKKNEIDWKHMKSITHFSFYTFSTRLLGFLFQRINILILGAAFNPQILGYFVFSSSFTIALLDIINKILRSVFFPFYSKIQDDSLKIRKYYITTTRFIAALVCPLAILIIFLGPTLIGAIWGTKWAKAEIPLRILALCLLIRVFSGNISPPLKGAGKIHILFRLQIIRVLIFRLPLTFLGIYLNGFNGFLYACLVYEIVSFFLDIATINTLFPLTLTDIIKMFGDTIISGLAMGSVFAISYYYFTLPTTLLESTALAIISLILYSTLFITLNNATQTIKINTKTIIELFHTYQRKTT